MNKSKLLVKWIQIALALLVFAAITPQANAATSSSATVIVQLADGTIEVRHIEFEGTISGLEALKLSGLEVIEKNGAVCRIGDTGCGADQDCFCACAGPTFDPCIFWNYQRWNGTAWLSSDQGAAQTTVSNGAIEGWTWGRALPAISPELIAASAGLQWLKQFQNTNGSYGAGQGNPGMTIDTILAQRALGGDPADFTHSTSGASLLDALRTMAPTYAALNSASVGKLMLGLTAADQDPQNFQGLNLVISATTTLDTSTGAFGTSTWDQSFAILGLRSARAAVPNNAITWLKNAANPDGGWGYSLGDDSDIDSTGLALQALISAGVSISDTAVISAVHFLDTSQNTDGGWAYFATGSSNGNSSAMAIQGLIAAGENLSDPRWQPSATTPISYLLSLQTSAGAFTYGGVANSYATQQIIPALAGQSLPFESRAVAQRLGLAYIASQQQNDGSFAGFGVGSSIDAILAIAATGSNPQSFVKGGKTPLDYLSSKAAEYATSASATGKLIVGVVAAGGNPQQFANLNLISKLQSFYDASKKQYGSSVYDHAWAMLALKAAGYAVDSSLADTLRSMQVTGGGWGFMPNDASADADSTGLALQALGSAAIQSDCGVSDSAMLNGQKLIRSLQNSDGAIGGYGGTTSASSTGLSLQALAAYQNPARSLGWWNNKHNPVDALLAMQTDQGGFPGFSGPNDPDSSYQALAGALGVSYPSKSRTLVFMPTIRR
jgi:hypothetical protein